MDRGKANQKYEELCRHYHVDIKIINIECLTEPRYSATEENGQVIISVNTAHIPDGKYESYLAYYISKVLLPRLILCTERLILRRFRAEDAIACFAFLSDPDGAYMDCCKAFTSMDEEFNDLMKTFARQETRYMIESRETGEAVGTIHIFEDNSRAVETLEIGYAFSPAHQRKGYAFETLSALLRLLQDELRFDMVVAGVLEENCKSVGLLEKLGFQREGIRHKAIWHDALDKPVDLVYYYRDR